MTTYGYLLFQQDSLPLQNKVTIVGRAPSCHIVFSHPSISKEHAIIEFTDDGAVIKDQNSMNGIYVNDNRVPIGGQVRLSNNSTIVFGKDPISYTFVINPENEKSKKANNRSLNALNERPSIKDYAQKFDADTRINLVDQSFDNLETAYNTRSKNSANAFHPRQNIKDINTGFQRPNISVEVANRRLQTPISAAKGQSEPYKSPVVSFSPQQKASIEYSMRKTATPYTQDSFNQYQMQDSVVEKKTNLAQQAELLEKNERILQKEEVALRKDNEINSHKNEIQSLKDECGKLKSKLRAIELYASDLQRKNDILAQEITERNAIIQELQSSDLTMKGQLNINEAKSLRQILLAKEDEINSMKRQLKAVLQSQSDPRVNYNHYEVFLEQQAKELASTKKQLQEYENRADECKRKWNQLIKENIAKEEKIKGITFQLNRQIESYQNLYSETDRKISMMNSKFVAVCSLVSEDRESSESQAAEYLIEQMKELQEERERIAVENEQLHLQIQDLIEETQRLTAQNQELGQYFGIEKPGMNSEQFQGPNLSKMKIRIDELEDLLYEIKQTDGARKVSELNETVQQLERKLALQEKNNQDLKDKLADMRANQNSINEQSAIEFFTKLLEDKEQQISQLKIQNDVLMSKDKQNQIEIERLKENLKESALQFENFKARQNKIDIVLVNKLGSPIRPVESLEQRSPSNVADRISPLLPDIRFAYDIPIDRVEQ